MLFQLTGCVKNMGVRWGRLAGILIVLVFLTVLASADSAGRGKMTADAAGPGQGGILQAAMPDLPAGVSTLQGTAARVTNSPAKEVYRTRLVLLGTTGGVTFYPDSDRASSSSALVVGDTLYIIDMGQGSSARLSKAFNEGKFVESPGGRIQDGSSTFLSHAKALFFTHLHQDHTADYPVLLLTGPGAGLGMVTDPVTNKTVRVPLKVFGPGNRGQLEADRTGYLKRGGQIISTDSADPALITTNPGTRQMTMTIWQAYAQTINDMVLDNGYPDFTKLVNVTEIGGTGPYDIPLPVEVADPDSETCPAMDPFEVYRDANVRVTATLVDHHQVFPAFAYRFDTADGSVVFSGDTGPDTKGNLQKLSKGADILVHEVIDPAWIDLKFGTPEPGSPMAALKTHMQESHTTPAGAGQVATDCGVRTLVLNHIVPGNTPAAHLQEAKKTFSGTLIIGEDLLEIGIGRAA